MAPSRDEFTAAEWGIIQSHGSPYRVQQFLNRLPYNSETEQETLRSFRGVVTHQSAHCLEAALAAAVVLEHASYPPLLLDLESQDRLDHVVFLYQQRGKWGTVARSRDPGLHGRKPVFDDVRQVVESYAEPFVDFSGRIVGYGVFDLRELGSYDWRLSRRNVWKVQRTLIGMRHQQFHMPNAEYQYWLERYSAYKRRHPQRKPLYYPNRRAWTSGYPRQG